MTKVTRRTHLQTLRKQGKAWKLYNMNSPTWANREVIITTYYGFYISLFLMTLVTFFMMMDNGQFGLNQYRLIVYDKNLTKSMLIEMTKVLPKMARLFFF